MNRLKTRKLTTFAVLPILRWPLWMLILIFVDICDIGNKLAKQGHIDQSRLMDYSRNSNYWQILIKKDVYADPEVREGVFFTTLS